MTPPHQCVESSEDKVKCSGILEIDVYIDSEVMVSVLLVGVGIEEILDKSEEKSQYLELYFVNSL